MVLISIRTVTLAILLVSGGSTLVTAQGPARHRASVAHHALSPRAMALFNEILERRGMAISKLDKITSEYSIPVEVIPVEAPRQVAAKPADELLPPYDNPPEEWKDLKNWEETAKSFRGRNYLVWIWLNASGDVRAQMPESFQMKMINMCKDEEELRRIVRMKRDEWSDYHKLLWSSADSEWPKTIYLPSLIHHLPNEYKKLDDWEKTVEDPNGRLYVLWRYLDAASNPKKLATFPDKLLDTMKSFLGGSRALQLQLYMRYSSMWDRKWEEHLESQWEYAVTHGAEETRRKRMPRPGADGQVKMQTDGRNKLKEITDALQASVEYQTLMRKKKPVFPKAAGIN